MREGRRIGRAGITLLEIVFASFIFSGLITMLGGVWVMHARAQRQTGQYLVAADLADLEMSHALALGYHDVAPSTGSYTQVWQVRGEQIEHIFNSQVEVIELVESGAPTDLKLIRVTISYPEGSGARNFKISSVLANEG